MVTRRVVNFPDTESDPRVMEAGAVSGGMASSRSLSEMASLSKGLELWPLLATAAMVFLLAEGAVTLWNPRRAKEEG